MRLKGRLYESIVSVPPPCAACLEFSGVPILDHQTLAQHGVAAEAKLELCFDPSRVTVKLFGVAGTGTPTAIWPPEPVRTMLTRLIRRMNPTVDSSTLWSLINQEWYIHSDADEWGAPGELVMVGTVGCASILDGATLIPGTKCHEFEMRLKESYVRVGREMKHRNRLVLVTGIHKSGDQTTFSVVVQELSQKMVGIQIEQLDYPWEGSPGYWDPKWGRH